MIARDTKIILATAMTLTASCAKERVEDSAGMTADTAYATSTTTPAPSCIEAPPAAPQSVERYDPDAVILESAVVDSVWRKAWWSDDDCMFTYLYEVRTTAARDTIRDVITPLPTSAGDTLVIGLVVVDTAAHSRTIFAYDARRRRVTHEAFPSDASRGLFDFSISPGGEHLLYTTWVSNPMGEVAVVRSRATGEIVVTGPRWPLCECDSDLHHARWVTADSFEIAAGAMGVWERVSGSISRRSLHRDTLQAEPKWH